MKLKCAENTQNTQLTQNKKINRSNFSFWEIGVFRLLKLFVWPGIRWPWGPFNSRTKNHVVILLHFLVECYEKNAVRAQVKLKLSIK
jgi:hypothetical protein